MHNLPDANFGQGPPVPPRFSRVPRRAALVVIAAGGVTAVAWRLPGQGLLHLVPGMAPTQFNTALALILLGAGLFLVTSDRRKHAVWPGAMAALLGVITLAEYVTGWDPGIDQMFCRAILAEPQFPGRPSILTAICLVLLGTGLVYASRPGGRRTAMAGLLASVVGIIGGVALCGYLFGAETSRGWGVYFQMPVYTAGILLVGASGLLLWAWQTLGRESSLMVRWLPGTATVTMMIMVLTGTLVNSGELHEATYWRRHSFQIVMLAQAFSDNLTDIQTSLRTYVTGGDTNALAAARAGEDLIPQQLAHLTEETADNTLQQAHLENLNQAVRELLSSDESLIAAYQTQGPEAAARLEATGQEAFLHARNQAKVFSAEEQRLLTERDASETADYGKVGRLLVAARAGVVLLLLAGNYMAAREMRRRRLSEARLTATLTLQNAILAASRYGIVAMDRHGVVKTFNPAAEKMLGYPAEEILGKFTPQRWSETGSIAAAPKLGMETLLARAGLTTLGESEAHYIRKNGEHFPALVSTTALADAHGEVTGFLVIFSDISERKQRESEREKLIAELKAALAEVKTLSGLIPICAWCKNVRSDKGFWQTVEQYVHTNTQATFSHGICPECAAKMLTAPKPVEAINTGSRN